ncbi:hypothetical protein RRG08_052619 [Elysia crispata]|uniref:Uncharacterized protein n=1 Tax=Elysia crispata TaxID=231223 RepID=A0AAE1AH41_9GAST|nr:hypothetical protein RRG08_052619 [Elysia crispata]
MIGSFWRYLWSVELGLDKDHGGARVKDDLQIEISDTCQCSACPGPRHHRTILRSKTARSTIFSNQPSPPPPSNPLSPLSYIYIPSLGYITSCWALRDSQGVRRDWFRGLVRHQLGSCLVAHYQVTRHSWRTSVQALVIYFTVTFSAHNAAVEPESLQSPLACARLTWSLGSGPNQPIRTTEA